jgi:hypothetical protein
VPEEGVWKASTAPHATQIVVLATAGRVLRVEMEFEQNSAVIHLCIAVRFFVVLCVFCGSMVDGEDLGGGIAVATEVLEGKAELQNNVIFIRAKRNAPSLQNCACTCSVHREEREFL